MVGYLGGLFCQGFFVVVFCFLGGCFGFLRGWVFCLVFFCFEGGHFLFEFYIWLFRTVIFLLLVKDFHVADRYMMSITVPLRSIICI